MVDVSSLIKFVTTTDKNVHLGRRGRDGSVVIAQACGHDGTDVYVLDDIQIEKLPQQLFNSDVEYFLLWFLQQHGSGKFYRAKKSLERWRGYRKATLCGYTNGPRRGGRYRAYSPYGSGLWWKPYSPDSKLYNPINGRVNGCNRRKDEPFRLTAHGVERAEHVWLRVALFLDTLVGDIKGGV